MKRQLSGDLEDSPGPAKKQKIGSDNRSASDILSFIEENQNIVQILQENTKNKDLEENLDDAEQLSTSLAQFVKSVQNDAFDIDFVVRTISKAKQNKSLNRRKFIKQLIDPPKPMTNLSILYYMTSSGVFTFKEYITTLDAKYYKAVIKNLADLFNKKNFEVFDEIFRQCIDLSFNDDRSTSLFSDVLSLFNLHNVFSDEDSFTLAKHCIDVIKTCSMAVADSFLSLLWSKLMSTSAKENLLEIFYNILERKKNTNIAEAIVSPFHSLLFDEFVSYFHEGKIIDTIFELVKNNEVKWSTALVFLLYLNESDAPFSVPMLQKFSQLTQDLLSHAIEHESTQCLQACIIVVYILSSRAEDNDQLQTYSNWFKRNFIEEATSVLKSKKARQLLITSLEAIVHTKDFYLLQIHSNLIERIPKIRNMASSFMAKSKSGLFNWDKQFSFRHLFPRTEQLPSSQQNLNIVNKVSSISSRDPSAIAFKAVKKYLQTNEVPQFVLQMRILNPKVFLESFAPALKKLSHESSVSSQNTAQAANKLLKHLVKLKHLPQRILLEENSERDDDVMIVENSFDVSIQLDNDQATLQDLDQLLNKREYKSIGERIGNETKRIELFIDWLIGIVPKHSTDVAALHAMCDLLIKNPINNPMLEEKLIKKSRSDLEGCSLLLALAGILANKCRLNTEIVDNVFRSFTFKSAQSLKEFTVFSLYYLNYMALFTKRTNEGFLPTFASQHLFWIYKRMKAYAKNQKLEVLKYKDLWGDLAAVFEKNGFSRSYTYRATAGVNAIPLKRFIGLELAFEENELDLPSIASMTHYINQMVKICLKGEFGSSVEKFTSFLLMELMQRECNRTDTHYSNYSNTFLLLTEQKLREMFLQLQPTKLSAGWLADRLLEVTKVYSTDKHVKIIAHFICFVIPPSLFFNSLQLKRRVMEMSHSKQNFSDLFSLYLQPDYVYEAVEASNIEYKELQSCLVDHTTVVRVLFRNWKNVPRSTTATNALFKFVASLYEFVNYVLYSSEPLEHVLLAKMIKTNEFLVFDSIIVAILNIEVPYSNSDNAYPLLFDRHATENSKVIEELFTNRLVPFIEVLSENFSDQFTEFFGQILRRLELHIQREGFDELGMFLLSKLIQTSFTIQPHLVLQLESCDATQQLLFFASITQIGDQIELDFSEQANTEWLAVLLKLFLNLLPADVALPSFLSFDKKALMDQTTEVIRHLIDSANVGAVQKIDVDVKIELQDLAPFLYEAISTKSK